MDGIEIKIGRIASKIKGGSKEERMEIAKELNQLAELLIDIKEARGDERGSLHSRLDD